MIVIEERFGSKGVCALDRNTGGIVLRIRTSIQFLKIFTSFCDSISVDSGKRAFLWVHNNVLVVIYGMHNFLYFPSHEMA